MWDSTQVRFSGAIIGMIAAAAARGGADGGHHGLYYQSSGELKTIRLLRPRRERPRGCCAAQERDELAPS